MYLYKFTYCMDEETDGPVNAPLIGPAVFEPQMDEDFLFNEGIELGELWEDVTSIENTMFMSEPFDGRYRESAYVMSNENEPGGYISFITYPNRIKIAPNDNDCPFETFKFFIEEFEDKVCELEFLGGLEEME